MKIAFHTNQICLQGTEIAVFDYAHFCEKLYGHEAIIISRNNKISPKGGAGKNQAHALEKFRKRFPVFLYNDKKEIDGILKKEKVDVFYAIKKGVIDGVESKDIKTVIHTVFKYFEPHGNVYAYVSKWLSDEMTGGKSPFVPHMINLPAVEGDLREELGIPPGATVLARYGGPNSFDIDFVHEAIQETVENSENIYFILMNTNDFMNPSQSFFSFLKSKKRHPRIIFLPGTSDNIRKAQFINTCDAMIHARLRGETFGIAIGEFSIHNRPVLTFGGRGVEGFEPNHLKILGDKGLIYQNKEELISLFHKIDTEKESLQNKRWDAYSEHFSPESVMKQFQTVFLS